MDLIEKLATELKDKHLTEFEKTRYIYRRICEIFSFNARFDFVSEKEKKLIREQEYDLRKLDTNLAVCHNFAKYIMPQAIGELTTYEAVPVIGCNHSLSRIKTNQYEWTLDPTSGDLARLKMNIPGQGMYAKDNDPDSIFVEYVDDFEELDEELGFTVVSGDYYRNKMTKDFDTSIEATIKLLSDSKCKYEYSDAIYLVNYCMLYNHRIFDDIMNRRGEFIGFIKPDGVEGSKYEIKKDDKEYKIYKIG